MVLKYPDSFEMVSVKCDQIGINGLSDQEKMIYTIWWLEAEVNNGGFHQYFWNSAGDQTEIALESLTRIGAAITATLLKQAIEIAFHGSLPKTSDGRQNQLEIDEDSKMEKLEDLDSEFYKYEEDLTDMLNQYLAKS